MLIVSHNPPIKTPTYTYLDYAAATPVHKDVQAIITKHLSETYGNPSAIHDVGRRARTVLETARRHVAKVAGIRPDGVTFTGSGTESNNLAIIGYIEHLHCTGRAYADMEVISTAIEHPSVLKTLQVLADKGVVIHYAPLTETGLIDIQQFADLLSPQTVLCSVAYANSEVGLVQPLRALARSIRAYHIESGHTIKLHTDAAQAPLWLPCQLEALGVDMMSLDAGKCYGPKGVGILLTRGSVALAPVLFGGSQEAGARPATENVPSIAGAAYALAWAQEHREEVSERVTRLRDDCIAALTAVPHVVLNGDHTDRLANNINISIIGYDSEFAVVSLDAAGVACSTRSACAGADGAGSTVVRALYHDEARAQSTLRFTLGVETTAAELEQLPQLLTDFMAKQAPYNAPHTKS